MSEAALYEKLLMRLQALEPASGAQLSDADALSRWEAFLLDADVNSITRSWREMETEDLYASSIGLSPAALAKLKQSMSKNAWSMLVEELRLRQPYYLAQGARARILHLLDQLEAMGEIIWASGPHENRGQARNWDAAKLDFEEWKKSVLDPLA